jgi:hypothetical protein
MTERPRTHVLTLNRDASQETLQRIHEWVADFNIAQILYPPLAPII